MLLWRDLKLLVTPSAYLFEDHMLNQMSSIEDDISDKTEDRIEVSHQAGKRLERRYKDVTDFTQSQTSQIKLQDLIYNPFVEIKLEHVKKKHQQSLNVKDINNVLIFKSIIIKYL